MLAHCKRVGVVPSPRGFAACLAVQTSVTAQAQNTRQSQNITDVRGKLHSQQSLKIKESQRIRTWRLHSIWQAFHDHQWGRLLGAVDADELYVPDRVSQQQLKGSTVYRYNTAGPARTMLQLMADPQAELSCLLS